MIREVTQPVMQWVMRAMTRPAMQRAMRAGTQPVMQRAMRQVTRCTVVAIVASGLAACGDGEGAPRGDAGTVSATSHAAAAPVGTAPAALRIGALEIGNVVAPAPVAGGDSAPPIAVYFLVMNTGARSDTLDAIEVAGARATMHDQVRAADGRTSMVPVEAASIPAGEMLRFIPGGRHVMVEGLTRRITSGDTLPLTLVFRHSGRAGVSARVVAYRDLDSAVAAGGDAHAGH